MEAQAPNSLGLLIGNLKLLNYDINDANNVFRLQLSNIDPSIYLHNTSQKLIIHTVHFLIRIICQNEAIEFENHFRIYYPPRIVQEQIEYKKQFIEYLRRLERGGRVPKNFQYCKAILDEKQGLRQFRFLRFLSEFALRHLFVSTFPTKQMRTFYPNPKDLMLGDDKNKPTFNDLSDIFSPASFQLESINGPQMERCSIDNETIFELISLVKYSICIQLNKLNKIFLRNIQFIDDIRYVVDYLVESNGSLRKQLIQLDQRQQNLKNAINPKHLTNDRQLDRIPLIDMYVHTLKGVRNLVNEFRRMKIDEKVLYFNEDFALNDQLSRLDKNSLGIEKNGLIDLNQVYSQLGQEMEVFQADIQEMKNKSWLMSQSEKLRSDSEELLLKLKSLKNK